MYYTRTVNHSESTFRMESIRVSHRRLHRCNAMHQKFLLETGFLSAYSNGTFSANRLAEFEKWLHLSIFECCLLLQTLNCFVLIIDMNHYAIGSTICDSKRCELNCERKGCIAFEERQFDTRDLIVSSEANSANWVNTQPNEYLYVFCKVERRFLSPLSPGAYNTSDSVLFFAKRKRKQYRWDKWSARILMEGAAPGDNKFCLF